MYMHTRLANSFFLEGEGDPLITKAKDKSANGDVNSATI